MSALSSLKDFLNSLEEQRARGKGRLGPAADREAIPEAVSEAVPTGTDPTTGGGLVDKIHIQPYAGSTYYQSVSSDGLFIEEYGDEITTIDADGTGTTNTWVEPDPNA